MTYSCQTWSLKKDIVKKVKVFQRNIERKILVLKQIDRIPSSIIRERTKGDDIMKFTTKAK